MSCKGTGGRRSGSDNAAKVSSVPGAIAAYRSGSQGSASARNFSPPHIGARECSPPLAEGFGIGSISDVCCGASTWCGNDCARGAEQSVPASSKEVA